MNLREFFEETGMKKIILSQRAKVPQSTICKLIEGADIKLSTAMRICYATKGKVTPQDLYISLLDKQMENKKNEDKS